MNIIPNSIIDKALIEMGFIRAEDFEGETYELNKNLENEDFINIMLIPHNLEDGTASIVAEWKLNGVKGSDTFVNTNPITVLSEVFEHFDESADAYEIREILEETMERISFYSCN